jgi:pimeloyl-ACP methyl ester carboxylesterase
MVCRRLRLHSPVIPDSVGQEIEHAGACIQDRPTYLPLPFRDHWGLVRRAFPNVIHFNEADRACHFAMWEHPIIFAEELRAAFQPLR